MRHPGFVNTSSALLRCRGADLNQKHDQKNRCVDKKSSLILSKHHQKLKCARLMQVRGNAPSYCFIRKVTRKCLVAHTRPRSEPRIANEGPKKPLTIARWRWRAPPRLTLRRGHQLPCAPGQLVWACTASLLLHGTPFFNHDLDLEYHLVPWRILLSPHAWRGNDRRPRHAPALW